MSVVQTAGTQGGCGASGSGLIAARSGTVPLANMSLFVMEISSNPDQADRR
ncbi:MAG: hypothetical protein ACK56I_17110 [bacterium]